MANFDRIEWNIITDAATSAAAIQTRGGGLVADPDHATCCRSFANAKGVKVKPMTSIGSIEIIRFNQLHPPFDNVKMRQAVLKVVNQKEYMQAGLWRRHERV